MLTLRNQIFAIVFASVLIMQRSVLPAKSGKSHEGSGMSVQAGEFHLRSGKMEEVNILVCKHREQ